MTLRVVRTLASMALGVGCSVGKGNMGRNDSGAATGAQLDAAMTADAGTVAPALHHGAHGGPGSHANLHPAAPMLKVEAWDGDPKLVELQDTNPDPKTVEVSLVAGAAEVEYLPGHKTMVWAYNGSVPGPLLRASVGDRVIVHFKNMLPEATTIHWHGVRVPAAMDGSAAAQSPVPSGGSFDYEFTVLDAGTFWYHPHVRSDVQIEKGLYGAIVIDDPTDPLADMHGDAIMLDDVSLDPNSFALDDTVDDRVMMMGREGNLALINGKRSGIRLQVRAGEPRRLRFINTAPARFFLLTATGATMMRIGGDRGLIEKPEKVDEVALVNGERGDVVVWADEPGKTATITAMPYERAPGAGATETVDLLYLVASNEGAQSPPSLPDSLRAMQSPAPGTAMRTIRFNERMTGSEFMFTINDASFPDVPLVESKIGTSETWTIINESDMDHPFHMHGFFFQKMDQREWRDSIDIPGNRTVILMPYFEDRPGASGRWMYHCHILGHAEHGMMGEMEIK